MLAQEMQLKKKKKKSPVCIQNCDQVEAVQRQNHMMVFLVVTGVMVFEILFKVMPSQVLHVEIGSW